MRTGSGVPNKADAAIGLREQRRGIDESEIDAAAALRTSSARMAEPVASRRQGRKLAPEPLPTVMTMSRLPP
jgi:hypothetical protein